MNTLPKEIKQAFLRAIFAFGNWGSYYRNEEPSIPVEYKQRSLKISEVCKLVMEFEDENLPGREASMLLLTPRVSRHDLVEKLASHLTYHTGAFCLSELINDRNKKWRRR